MELKDLMEAFGAAFKIADLKPNDAGIYTVKIDEMKVSFASDPDSPRLVTWGEVGALPPEGREKLFRVLLESMYMGKATGGATFCIDPETETLSIFRSDPLPLLDLETFSAMLEKFANVLGEWRKIVADYREVASKLEKVAAADEESLRQLRMSGFMQV